MGPGPGSTTALTVSLPAHRGQAKASTPKTPLRCAPSRLHLAQEVRPVEAMGSRPGRGEAR
jgi:hypothetical protein